MTYNLLPNDVSANEHLHNFLDMLYCHFMDSHALDIRVLTFAKSSVVEALLQIEILLLQMLMNVQSNLFVM